MDKPDFLMWSRKYDKAYGWQAQRERELGAKFRKTRALTKDDLAKVVEWKFSSEPDKRERLLELVARNNEETVQRLTSQVFCNPTGEDTYKISCLTTLEGISPLLASIILTFFDPRRFGIIDIGVWKPLLGNPPANLYSTQNYVKLLAALRKTAAKHNLDVRVVEKALYKKSLDEAK